MKKLCALLALLFVFSIAGGVFGQDSRDRRDEQNRRDSSRSYQENTRRNHHRHRHHGNNWVHSDRNYDRH
jgi:hypothetical protein